MTFGTGNGGIVTVFVDLEDDEEFVRGVGCIKVYFLKNLLVVEEYFFSFKKCV